MFGAHIFACFIVYLIDLFSPLKPFTMFTSISNFSIKGKETHSIASKLEGTLLISSSYFPYFMLIAFEAGSPMRAFLLLIISPFLFLLQNIHLKHTALQLTIFISLAGLRLTDVKAVAKSVLPRFFLEDVRENVHRVFSSCGGKKYIVSSIPRIVIEPFLHEYLNVDFVIGTELKTFNGFCLGLVTASEVRIGASLFQFLKKVLGDGNLINIGIGNSVSIDNSYMFLCQEGYVVEAKDKPSCLLRKEYPKPLIFHDGRLVARPTALDSLAVFLWLPAGVLLAISRLAIGKFLPYSLGLVAAAATGFRIRAKLPSGHSNVPHSPPTCEPCPGTLYVCSHRTLIDPVIVATTLQRPITALTYSVSRISEVLSPIRTVRLNRERAKDGDTMQKLLKKGELVVCPEGTTCREPYLLRFSPLFAEIAEIIIPVAISAKASMFHGTTVRGHKWLDSFFFLMNPNPEYQLEFLEKVSGAGASERSSYEMANHVQKTIGQALGFECTNLTRKDKYRMLAGNDGV